MKKVLAILFILCVTTMHAQKTYTINGESLVLNKETEGPIYFLWNSTNGQFRYFIQTKNDDVVELTNTKDLDNNYKEEYKDALYNATGSNPAEVKLTTYSILDFVKKYNQAHTTSETYPSKSESNKPTKERPFSDRPILDWRFGTSAGFTNHPFITNPEGFISMTFQTELEVFQESLQPRHSLFMGLKFSPSTAIKENIEYMSIQPSLGYRFRFINLENVNFHIGTKFAVFTYSEQRVITDTSDGKGNDNDPSAMQEIIKRNRNFDFPFIFALGTDIKVKENAFITILFDSLFSLFQKSKNSTFPLDISIGYKFNL